MLSAWLAGFLSAMGVIALIIGWADGFNGLFWFGLVLTVISLALVALEPGRR